MTGLTSGAITGVLDRLERVGFARRARDLQDRRKILVSALPAVAGEVAPLFAPMNRAAQAALSAYRDEELEIVLDFLIRAREAGLAAMAELHALSAQPKRGRRRNPTAHTARKV